MKDYVLSYVSLAVSEGQNLIPANRALHFLVSENLPAGLEIISETHALKVGAADPAGLQEFSGQLLINVPEGVNFTQVDFIRVLPQFH